TDARPPDPGAHFSAGPADWRWSRSPRRCPCSIYSPEEANLTGILGATGQADKKKPTWPNTCEVFDHVGLLVNGPSGTRRLALHLVFRLELEHSAEPRGMQWGSGNHIVRPGPSEARKCRPCSRFRPRRPDACRT